MSAGGLRPLLASKRATLGLSVLSTLLLLGVFADLLASDKPIVRASSAGLELWPETALPEDEAARFEWWAPCRYGPRGETSAILAPPSRLHPLGTDERGRDVLARSLHGARAAFATGLLVVIIGAIGGLFAGVVSSSGRMLGRSVERLAQSVDAFPAVVVVALFRAVEGRSSALSAIVGASLVQWAVVARLVRTEVQLLSAEDFAHASRALGATRWQVLRRHVLPHLTPSLAASAALGLSAVVVLEATLSFLGLGPPIAGASWGEMLAEGARHPEHTQLFFWPVILLTLTVGSAYLVAEGIRSVGDPVLSRVRAIAER